MVPYQIRQTQSWLPTITRIADAVSIFAAAFAAQTITGQDFHSATWSTATLAVLAFILSGELLGIYRELRRSSNEYELGMVLTSWLMSLAFTTLIGFVTRSSETHSRLSGLAWLILAGLMLMLARMILRGLAEIAYRRGIGVKRTAIAGTGELAIHVAQNAKQFDGSGFKIVGFYDDRNEFRRTEVPGDLPAYIGKLDELIADARNGKLDTVLITLPMRAEKRIQELLTALADTTASTYIVPDFFVFELLHSRWTEFGGLPVVSVFETPIYGIDGWAKRAFDFVVAALAIILLSPVLIACAIAVKISSAGPVIFRQKRYGLDGKEILVWKFRSMKTCDNGPVVLQATRNDPRVTRVGSILRRTSLDELPQLFNVLMGTMSLVGPRPHASAHNEQFRKIIRGYMMRHKVRPGITGMAQVFGSRGETDTVEKMEARIALDHRYIRDWSLWMDIRIILRTFFVVLKHDAY